ncbi:MAG: hypothetical protein AB7G75_02565 [Candidatus Binatia bacterium]
MRRKGIRCYYSYYSGVAFALAMSMNAVAAEQPPLTRIHRGTIVSVAGDTLIAQGLSEKKKEHTYHVAPTATVVCEGQPCKLSDLKTGELVTVTTEQLQGGEAQVVKIFSKRPVTSHTP